MASLPVLYSFRRCPYAMRARLALTASGLQCELREVVLRNKPQALRDASSKATVPVLIQPDGSVLDESLDIMLWALRRADPLGWLAPDSTRQSGGAGAEHHKTEPAQDPTKPGQSLEAMLALIQECDRDFKPCLDRYKYPPRYPESDPMQNREQAAQWLSTLDGRLSRSPFLFGHRAALADMAIAPFVRQFAHTDKDWFRSQPWPALQAWLQAWLNSQIFERVMRKYPAWQSGTEGERFPP